MKQLKDIYKRLKIQAKKAATKAKKHAAGTGDGGPSTEEGLSNTVQEQLLKINPTLTAEIHNRYDDDAETEESSDGDKNSSMSAEAVPQVQLDPQQRALKRLPALRQQPKSLSWCDEVKSMARKW